MPGVLYCQTGRGPTTTQLTAIELLTPYHEIHGTKVMGFMTIQHGDNKFYNNIFVQQQLRPEMQKLAEMKATSQMTG